MQGFNGTIFAFGQTSSGKTHTMMGTTSQPGLIPLAINAIFNIIENVPEREYLIRISYIEIYNENIMDLLDTTCGKNLQIRDNAFASSAKKIKNTPTVNETVSSDTQLRRYHQQIEELMCQIK
ncbi:hypothetical protein V5799_013098, partial [Amblyomma americanum]